MFHHRTFLFIPAAPFNRPRRRGITKKPKEKKIDFPSDDSRPDLHQLFSYQSLKNLNKGNLQFSGHTFIYKQSIDDLTLAQFLKHVITPKNGRFSIASIRKLVIGGFGRKRNRSNTSTELGQTIR